MKIYSKASDRLVAQVAAVMAAHCPDLSGNNVRVDCLNIAHDDPDNEDPPLKLHGYACAAVVRILGAKERAKGQGDAEIVFDEATFLRLPEPSQVALIHHELHHLELKRDGKGRVKFDEYRRPKLTMRLHDRQFGWFDEIARVHGTASLEVQQSSALLLGGKQLYFAVALNGDFVPNAAAELVA